MTNYMDLQAELALPAYAGKTDLEAADLLNAKVINHPKLTVTTSDLIAYCFTKGIIRVIESVPTPINLWEVIEAKKLVPGPFRTLAAVFDHANSVPLIDFYEGARQRIMLDAGIAELVADDSLTHFIDNSGIPVALDATGGEALLAEILALAPKISRAEQLGVGTVLELDVSRARQHAN